MKADSWQNYVTGRRVFSVLAVAVPAVAVFGHRGMPVLLGLAALACLIDLWRRGTLSEIRRGPVAALLLAGVAWGTTSALWAVDGMAALEKAGRLTPTFFAIAVLLAAVSHLTREDRYQVGRWLIAGMTIAGALHIEEVLTGDLIGKYVMGGADSVSFWQGFKLNGGIAIFLILAWPLMSHLWRSRQIAGSILLSAVIGFVGWNAPADTAKLALAAAAATFVLVLLLKQRVVAVIGAVVVAAFIAAPIFPLTVMTPERVESTMPDVKRSLLHRTIMWEFAAHRIVEKPLIGWGLNSSRRIPGGDQPVPRAEARHLEGNTVLGLHPHNAALQAWLELGLPGAALLAAVVGLAFRPPARTTDIVARAGAAAGTMTVVVFALSSWGVWQNWWMAAAALAAVITIAISPLPKDAES